MNVLVCEDDPAARFVIKRWLSSTLGCTVTDCEDGVKALDLLSTRPFDLALLDLDLPRMAGVEVVEAIRDNADVHDLPIVILSNERSQDTVRRLVSLGVSDYLLKPLRAQAVRDRIGPLLARRRVRAAGVSGPPRLTADVPALLVDGDVNFRHVFASVAGQFGAVITADSGAEALSIFRRTPVDLVFVGDQLGIMGAEVLIRKIREGAEPNTVFVKVGDGPGPAGLEFTATIPRAFVPEALASALKPFVRMPGPLTALRESAPNFEQCLDTAVEQVFGMMTGLTAWTTSPVPVHVAPGVMSLVTVTIAGQWLLDLELVLPTAVARDLGARMLGCTDAELDDDAVAASTGELANMVSGRLDAWLKGQGQTSVCTLPEMRVLASADALPLLEPGAGYVHAYEVEGHRPPALLRATVRRPH